MIAAVFQYILVAMLVPALVLAPLPAVAIQPYVPGFNDYTPPTQALRVPTPLAPSGQGFNVRNTAEGRQEIDQSDPTVIIRWKDFDIGADAAVRFNQRDADGNPASNFRALNRIEGQNPSKIFGCLEADGRVYLLNRNGILFGPGSKVNVHTLVATSLNTTDEAFLGGVANTANSVPDVLYTGDGSEGAVENYGSLIAKSEGNIFLIGPKVANGGTISTLNGEAVLAATRRADIEEANLVTSFRVPDTENAVGVAANLPGGSLLADSLSVTGRALMFGDIVQQEGLVRSITAIRAGGSIQLVGKSRIVTGPGSVTSCEISDSDERLTLDLTVPRANSLRGEILLQDAEVVELNGAMIAPGGRVRFGGSPADRVGRVYMAEGSVVDVSGEVVERAADDNLIDPPLNSLELADDFGQKDSELNGADVTAHVLNGSAIGNISGSLQSAAATAREANTQGGDIEIFADEFIMRGGSVLDFSGGSMDFAAGFIETTKLVNGNRIYDISNAPQYLPYTLLGDREEFFARQGVLDVYPGAIQTQGGVLLDFVGSYREGRPAGTLILTAQRFVLEGSILGLSPAGFFQNEEGEAIDPESGAQATRGLADPIQSLEDGRFVLGNQGLLGLTTETDAALATDRNQILDAVRVVSTPTPLPVTFNADSPFPVALQGVSELPASLVSNSNVNSLEIYTNRFFDVAPDAALNMLPGGRLVAWSRSIHQEGRLIVPNGTIELQTLDTSASLDDGFTGYQPRMFFGEGSRTSVAGLRIDNSLAAGGFGVANPSRFIGGGSIELTDATWLSENRIDVPEPRSGGTLREGIIVAAGAVVDVGGGFRIDEGGRFTAGDAGSLELTAPALALEGNLLGLALAGKQGGSLSLHAENLTILPAGQAVAPAVPDGFGPNDPFPASARNRYVLAADRFAESGFSMLSLTSRNDLVLSQGVFLEPSLVRLSAPTTKNPLAAAPLPDVVAAAAGRPGLDGNTVQTVSPDLAGPTGVALESGDTVSGFDDDILDLEQIANPRLTRIESGAGIRVAPEGEIEVEGPLVEIAGLLEARAGSISASSGFGDLRVLSGARLDASGTLRQTTEAPLPGLRSRVEPLPGGGIFLSSDSPPDDATGFADGSIVVQQGAVLDVSGSPAVENDFLSATGTIFSQTEASSPGTMNFTFGTRLLLEGDLLARAAIPGLTGGALTIDRVNRLAPLVVSDTDIARYQSAGFDALSFISDNALVLDAQPGAGGIRVSRQMTLDAPFISGMGSSTAIQAPWLILTNTFYPFANQPQPPTVAPPAGTSLLLEGGFIDVAGNVFFTGYESVEFVASNDIRLADVFYSSPDGNAPALFDGLLDTQGDLTLGARRIYTTTNSIFTLGPSQGKLSILATVDPGSSPIASAGSVLRVRSRDLELDGFLAAPQGIIDIRVAGRAQFNAGSTLTTQGNMTVEYGSLSSDLTSWSVASRPTLQDAATGTYTKSLQAQSLVTGQLETGVHVEADEVVTLEGSIIDTSGGGGITARLFLSGVAGSVNPLTVSGRYVIVPGVNLPGRTLVIQEGSSLLAAGEYSILPAEFAFLPGALVLESVADSLLLPPSAGLNLTEQGFVVVAGFEGVAGTSLSNPRPGGFAVRTAAAVLAEGEFAQPAMGGFPTGRSGDISILAPTAVVEGSIRGNPLEGFQGGKFLIGGATSAVLQNIAALPAGFAFDDAIPASLLMSSRVATSAFQGSGLGEVQIGDLSVTRNVVVSDGANLEASAITFEGSDSIVFESGTSVAAADENGILRLRSPAGVVTIESGASLRSAGDMEVEALAMNLAGQLAITGASGALTLTSNSVALVDDQYAGALPGNSLQIFDNMQGLVGISSLVLNAGSVNVLGNVDLAVPNELVLRTPVINQAGASAARLTAGALNLQSDATAEPGNPSLPAAGTSLTLSAGSVNIGPGALAINDFDNVAISSSEGLTFTGQGYLYTAGALTLSAREVALRTDLSRTDFEVARARVRAGRSDALRALAVTGSGTDLANAVTFGGSLSLLGSTVAVGTRIDTDAARIELNGPGGINLLAGASIAARASADMPGGKILLASSAGGISVASGVVLDVSSANGQDAGSVCLSAPAGALSLAGTFQGGSVSGRGGSLEVDGLALGSLDFLAQTVTAGGFDNEVIIRSRTGDLVLSQNQQIVAERFSLAADSGRIDLHGDIATAASKGGRVEVHAGNGLTLHGTASIDASAQLAGEEGGYVFLNAQDGDLLFVGGALVNVSAGSGGPGGTAHFRARRTANAAGVANRDVRMTLDGTVLGAASTIAEAFAVYTDEGTLNATDVGTGSNRFTEARDFVAGYSGPVDDIAQLLAGVEVRSNGALNLDAAWNLGSWRTAIGRPVMLTLRSAGNLTINQNLFDGIGDIAVGDTLRSGAITLVAGADFAAANPLQSRAGVGTLTVASSRAVFTERAPLSFAAGLDVVVNQPASSGILTGSAQQVLGFVSLGTFTGDIEGRVGRNLLLSGGVVQSGTGDITIRADAVQLSNNAGRNGSIRTTGLLPSSSTPFNQFSQYRDGGDISVTANQDIRTTFANSTWGERYNSTTWGARYLSVNRTTGIAAMGGGSISIRAGGNVEGQIGVFGLNNPGNLTITSGRNVDGHFLVRNGRLAITALENFGRNLEDSGLDIDTQFLELFDATLDITAQGSIRLGGISNPAFITTGVNVFDFTERTAATLRALNQDIEFASLGFNPGAVFYGNTAPISGRLNVLPATLRLEAGRDILFQGGFILAPGRQGNLTINAGRDVTGRIDSNGNVVSSVLLSDRSPEEIYGQAFTTANFSASSGFLNNPESNLDARDLIHVGDPEPVRITAGRDIARLALELPKQAELIAGRDVVDLTWTGQHLAATDVSLVRATRNIIFQAEGTELTGTSGYTQYGPGHVVFSAGGNVDMGITSGIQSIGSGTNRRSLALLMEDAGAPGASIIVAAGYDSALQPQGVRDFFFNEATPEIDSLREYAVEYVRFLESDPGQAATILQALRQQLVGTFLQPSTMDGGNLQMLSSRIFAGNQGGDIFVIARESANLGRSSVGGGSNEQGVTTAGGGDISFYLGKDLNVFESRVVTFFGGDILIYSDTGDIQAGRGSATAVSSPLSIDPISGEPRFTPPAVGSGIRTLTFDPDGPEGAAVSPDQGDVVIVAPDGTIDAGEAGIAGADVVLGAVEVLNAQNITVAGVSVGVPAQSAASTGIGGLTGVSTFNEIGSVVEQAVGSQASQRQAQQAAATAQAQDLVAKILDVKVLEYLE